MSGEKHVASKVRNGFVPRLRREVWAKLKHLQTGTWPFANLPKRNGRNGRLPVKR